LLARAYSMQLKTGGSHTDLSCDKLGSSVNDTNVTLWGLIYNFIHHKVANKCTEPHLYRRK